MSGILWSLLSVRVLQFLMQSTGGKQFGPIHLTVSQSV